MYQNIHYDRKKREIHIWDDKTGYHKTPYKPYGFILDSQGHYNDLFGNNMTKVYNTSEYTPNELSESDVLPETRYLIDNYLESEIPSDNHNILTFDIEVEKTEEGYSDPMKTANKINAISLYSSVDKQYIAIILDEDNRISDKVIGNRTIISVASEKDLLLTFFKYYRDINPTILTGWNIDSYDVPYLYNRSGKIVGKQIANSLSPIGIVKKNFTYDEDKEEFSIAGVSCLDYITLYKNFNFSEKPSYSLNNISLAELGRGKIEYDGDLRTLFNSDIDKFIEYSIVDVELVVEMDKKLDFIELARGIAHKGYVPYESVYHSSKFLDGASLAFLRRKGIVAPNKKPKVKLELLYTHKKGDTTLSFNIIPPDTPGSGQLKIFKSASSHFKVTYSGYDNNEFTLNEPLPSDVTTEMEVRIDLPGAFVKDPKVGRHAWVYDEDLTSLYPSIIMSLGISPETQLGKILNFDNEEYLTSSEKQYDFKVHNDISSVSKTEFKDVLLKNNYSISASGVIYDKNKKGFIPAILEAWFNERVEFKNLMKKYKTEGDVDKTKFYHLRQLVTKVMLNSFYGVLALPGFRFYNINNAESTTATGQQIIKFSAKMANHYYNQICGTKDEDYCIYVDTDSIFYSSLPIIKTRYPNADYKDDVFMTEKTLEISGEIQKFINKSYDIYAKKFHNLDEHKFDIKQELVCKSAFFVAKKRYAMSVINEEGVMLPKPHLEIKGLDVVRSSFPKAFKTFMSETLVKILNGTDNDVINTDIVKFKKSMPNMPIQDVMINGSIKNIKKYNPRSREKFQHIKATPAHIKAGLNYNDLLKHFKIKDIAPITNGDKVKYAYLTTNPFRLGALCIKGYQDPTSMEEILAQYIDYNHMFDSQLQNKLQDFYTALGWGTINSNAAAQDFFNF